MNKKQLTELLIPLLAAQSYDRSTSRVPELIGQWLEGHGITADVIERAGVKNLVARTPGTARILFNGHWDTVAVSSFSGDVLPVVQTKTDIHGLGACDMKAGVAAMMAAFVMCVQKKIPGVILCLVGDEELGGENGTQMLVEKNVVAPVVVLGEPTKLHISSGQKGAFRMLADTRGTPAHSAYVQRGDNAIVKMTGFIQAVTSHFLSPYLSATTEQLFSVITASINRVQGGTGDNVIPAGCMAVFDVRFPGWLKPGEVMQRFNDMARAYNVRLTFDAIGYGWSVDHKAPLSNLSARLVETVTGTAPDYITKLGTNDGGYYAAKGCQVINIGPGDSSLAHTDAEHVSIDQVLHAKEIYFQLAKNL